MKGNARVHKQTQKEVSLIISTFTTHKKPGKQSLKEVCLQHVHDQYHGTTFIQQKII